MCTTENYYRTDLCHSRLDRKLTFATAILSKCEEVRYPVYQYKHVIDGYMCL
eukprot:COSAG05_NODE_22478_length_264_cov_1.193939_1_plen_51_part_01